MSLQIASKYAKALYDVSDRHEAVLNELRCIEKLLNSDSETITFFKSEGISAETKVAVITKAFSEKGLSPLVLQTLKVMAEKGRISLFSGVLASFQALADKEHGVIRGGVKSAAPLDPEARKRIEAAVAKVTQKKVILTFAEDPKLVGGVIAKVGGWTFEDTLESHITRLREELNRRAN